MQQGILKDLSFISTVFNESESIDAFMQAILKQKNMPSELIIVDGGSKDKTFEKLKDIIGDYCFKGLQSTSGDTFKAEKELDTGIISFTIVRSGGVNISRGRNIAIGYATKDLICASDAGCIAAGDWVEEISRPVREGKYEIAGGITLAIAESILERALASCVIHKESEIDKENFMPSSRNICFRKDVFKAAGGYPEGMDYGEDMKFDISIRQMGYPIGFIPQAKVYWRMRKDLKSIFKQFFRYAKGDALGRMYPLRHIIRFLSYALFLALVLLSIFLSIYFLFAFVPLLILYYFKPFSRVGFIYDMTGGGSYKLLCFFTLVFLVPFIDAAKASGYMYGLKKRS